MLNVRTIMNDRVCGVFTALTLMTAPAAVHAQATTPTATSSQLEEVVVTATRREESVEKVPISIQAFDQQALTQNGIKSISDLAAMVPGLQYQPNGQGIYANNTAIAIRGFNSMAGPSTVGIYLDDAPLQGRMSPVGNVGYIFPLVFDVDRVEVLRGPQGTLFGASSESGAIRFITNQPSLTQFSGFSHAEYSATQDGAPSYETGAAFGGPIVNDELGFRVSAWIREDGGYIGRISPVDDQVIGTDSNSDKKAVIRAALAFKTGDVLITPSIFYQLTDENQNNAFYDYYSNPSDGYFLSGKLIPETSSEHLIVPSVKVEAPLSFANLTANASYISRGFNENQDLSSLTCALIGGCGNPAGPGFASSFADAAPSTTGQDLQTYSAEVRLASNSPNELLSWVAGLYWDHRRQRDYQTVTDTPSVVGFAANPAYYINQFIWDDQYAGFAQGDLHVTSKLTLTLGVREELARSSQLNYTGEGWLNSGAPPEAHGSQRETATLPKATISYQFTAENLLYASAGKGLRVGGSNAGLPSFCGTTSAPNYSPDSLWSYEIGTKDRFLNGRIQLDTSIYHIRWSNIQSIVFLACGQAYTGNVGTADSDGFDFALQALITDELRLDLNVGYADARYVSNSYSPSGAILAVKGDAVQALNFVNPPWDVSVAPEYTFPLAGGDKLLLRAQYIYHSHNNRPVITEDPSSPSYTPADVPDPATHLTNFRATYTRGAFDVGAYLNNAFNSHPLLGAYQDIPTSNLIMHSTFRPRTLGVSLNYSF
jgi:iron complex outermembrane recepter protein